MELRDFFKIHCKIALAFSGGADSSYLLYAALKSGVDVKAYFLKSQFQPRFELEDARRIASQLGAHLCVIEEDMLSCLEIANNGPERCYHCKKRMIQAIMGRARLDGYFELMDGSNASDNPSDRPGMKALAELEVLSPLLDYGIGKEDIAKRLKQTGLHFWNKSPYSCLATRINQSEALSEDKLDRIERSEDYLRSLGFKDFRVRSKDGIAKIQIRAEQFTLALNCREAVCSRLGEFFDEITLDLEARNG